jgi:hypothetical protein
MLRCRLWRGGPTTVGTGVVTISISVSDCRSLTNGSALPSRETCVSPRHFTFEINARPPELSNTWFDATVDPLSVTPVISPVGSADDRWDAVDRVSCTAVISIGKDSEFRGNFLVWSPPPDARARRRLCGTVGMRARLLGTDRVESRQGQDTEEFDPLAAPALHWPVTLTCWRRMRQLRHDVTLAQTALAKSSSQTNSDFDLSCWPTLADVEVRL